MKGYVGRAALVSIVGLVGISGALAAPADKLKAEFKRPPPEARPRVWWHWMNGNISAEGAKQDLAWLQRIGIGGVQLFEAGMGTPTVVHVPDCGCLIEDTERFKSIDGAVGDTDNRAVDLARRLWGDDIVPLVGKRDSRA